MSVATSQHQEGEHQEEQVTSQHQDEEHHEDQVTSQHQEEEHHEEQVTSQNEEHQEEQVPGLKSYWAKTEAQIIFDIYIVGKLRLGFILFSIFLSYKSFEGSRFETANKKN